MFESSSYSSFFNLRKSLIGLSTVLTNSGVISGDQLYENIVSIQRFGDCLCIHHQGLM
jgi:hypothetical protein